MVFLFDCSLIMPSSAARNENLICLHCLAFPFPLFLSLFVFPTCLFDVSQCLCFPWKIPFEFSPAFMEFVQRCADNEKTPDRQRDPSLYKSHSPCYAYPMALLVDSTFNRFRN